MVRSGNIDWRRYFLVDMFGGNYLYRSCEQIRLVAQPITQIFVEETRNMR